MQHQLGSTVGVLLCAVTILVVLSVIGSIVLIYKKRKRCRQDFLSSSGRLRDRLDTTEFMNSLATIDRKLTLDEILEKRRKAMWSHDLRLHQSNEMIVTLD
ncbi:uncharacterized protein LOC111627357 [Centruroides sculpturatus]|uniref:uncharacterized protein LOC111627356 n=1 Tax=Centruroides sculpturatus TaxID=218467 RepID=UPI000C6EF307|nr:uncharacterized protein LOC111627356 [Centruroides sculpturatus]XP_023226683.1 uncharacterized protein LOC111627357 [Centruroides sculpturatus]